MKTKTILLVTVTIVTITATVYIIGFTKNDSRPTNIQVASAKKSQPEIATPIKKDIRPVTERKLKKINKTPPVQTSGAEPDIETEPEEPATVESLKEYITDIAVEYIEDIPLLDELVQESASEPEELWEGEWVSIDDWKRNSDSFSVEKNDDGSFELIPDRDSSQSYSYNEETKEFEWVLDYYGKKVTHKAKFISEDVMVLMKISGVKVALDIYKRDAG